MKTFIIEVMDDSKVEFVETLLSEINGISVTEKKEKASPKKKAKTSGIKKKDDLFANSFGMWKGSGITMESIRDKAWRKSL